MNEFVDLSGADMSHVTPQALATLAQTLADVFEQANALAPKTAVYSPTDLPFGLARLYGAYTHESPETVRVFRDADEALRWLSA